MLRSCFDYPGGVPEELVFDQDKLLAVNENYGDIIYTYEFEKFKQVFGFEVWLCRKSDAHESPAIESAGIWPLHLRVRAEHRNITAYTELLGGDAR